MKAIGLTRFLPLDDADSLKEFDVPAPIAQARDLLVRVKAISVNPVDAKVRSTAKDTLSAPKILGYDAAGVVEAVGSDVTLFKPGDEVFYAGDITRPGTNAELHVVDERIVGRRPASLDFAESAALPLTSMTAWELMFERMHIDVNGADRGKRLLILSGAGGVGSMAIQLAKLAGLVVIATASRAETQEWCKTLGADYVIDHRKPIKDQLKSLEFERVDFIVNLVDTDGYWQLMGELIAPQGHIGCIVEPKKDVYVGNPLKDASVGIHWESMFTRSRHKTADMIEQHKILDRVADLVDAGKIRSTLFKTFRPINAENLREAHKLIESGKSIGKMALDGWL
ncbi:MAG TPA: zinc-binding alcohol dehydrogenase family protein [Rudaea sp.]|jgi:NADPH2:quinone reductase|nr:zinc-binding alcohol dehydrogenase family protein [Rudaea sp.]